MKIVLGMIVKNEEKIVRRCLESVASALTVDQYVIHDTGSTDDTVGILNDYLCNEKAHIGKERWRDFSTNRNLVLEECRGTGADYTLMIDADDILVQNGRNMRLQIEKVEADGFNIPIHYGDTRYNRVQVFKNDKPWKYEGVVHEAAVCVLPATIAQLNGVYMQVTRDGARAKDTTRYLQDAAMLMQADGSPRNVFYTAQSFRDGGAVHEAKKWYQLRVAMGGYEEEVYYSMLQIANLDAKTGENPMPTYLAAWEMRPRRAEALTYLATWLRGQKRWAPAFMYATAACHIERPDDTLFVDESVYVWRSLDERATAATWLGKYNLALRIYEKLLNKSSQLPEADKYRIQENYELCVRMLART